MSEVRHKRGDVREDGKVFWRYSHECLNGEQWVSKDQYSRYRASTIRRAQSKYSRDSRPILDRNAKWRRNNLGKVRAVNRAYGLSNRARRDLRVKDWVLANPERARANGASSASRRRARLRKATPSDMTYDDRRIALTIYEISQRVSRCTGVKFHVDHVTPITKDGLHHPSNLQVLPATINLRKFNKLDFRYPETVAA